MMSFGRIDMPAGQLTPQSQTQVGADKIRHSKMVEVDVDGRAAALAQDKRRAISNTVENGPKPRQRARTDGRGKKIARQVKKALCFLGNEIMLSFAATAPMGLHPAHITPVSGTTHMQNEQQQRAVDDIVANPPNPWHEYERLDSAEESETYNPYYPVPKKSRRERLKDWFNRVTNKHGDLAVPSHGGTVVGTIP